MNKLTSKFIENVNKSNQKPVVEVDAFTGKRVRPGSEHDVTKKDILWIIGSLIIVSIFACFVGN